jgi:3-methyladenine DNA glycosylase Mpg
VSAVTAYNEVRRGTMSYEYSDTITLVTVECYSCAITFAVSAEWQKTRRNDHVTFYCPNGHAQSYLAKSAAETLRVSLEREQREAASLRERAIGAERAKAKAEASLRRHKKRAAAGICPCCTRTVSQLAEHMKAKHPQYRELQGLEPRKQIAEKVQ